MKTNTKAEKITNVICLFIFLFASMYLGLVCYIVSSLIFIILNYKKLKSEDIKETQKENYKKAIKYHCVVEIIAIIVLLILSIFEFLILK